MVQTGLRTPPRDLDRFPTANGVAELHRLSEWPDPWWFSSVAHVDEQGGGRFDLPAPHGTCYLAEESLDGALVEKLLRVPVKVVPAERLGELFHAVVSVRRTPLTADLTSAKAAGYGLNAEIHTTLDYATCRRWGMALWKRGWRAASPAARGCDPGPGRPCRVRQSRPACTRAGRHGHLDHTARHGGCREAACQTQRCSQADPRQRPHYPAHHRHVAVVAGDGWSSRAWASNRHTVSGRRPGLL